MSDQTADELLNERPLELRDVLASAQARLDQANREITARDALIVRQGRELATARAQVADLLIEVEALRQSVNAVIGADDSLDAPGDDDAANVWEVPPDQTRQDQPHPLSS